MRLATDYPLQCACGQLKGTLVAGAKYMRAVCYCRDCQAYAESLGEPGKILDANGGTDVVASLQSHVRFTDDIEQLACLSLTERGLLRWYAACCGTPIANTPRDPKISYVGIIHTALDRDASHLDSTFGPPQLATNVDTARGAVASSGVRTLTATLRIIARIVQARIDGSWRRSPFFGSDFRPVVKPRVLGPRPP
jgi:hypothetical protein